MLKKKKTEYKKEINMNSDARKIIKLKKIEWNQ